MPDREDVTRDGVLGRVAHAHRSKRAGWFEQPGTTRYAGLMTSLLCPDAFLSPLEIDAVVTRALAEDLGRAGDVTSIATIPEDTQARAIVVARKAGVISGLPFVAASFQKLAPDIDHHGPRP